MKSNSTVSDVTGDEVGYHGGASEYTAGRLGKEHRAIGARYALFAFFGTFVLSFNAGKLGIIKRDNYNCILNEP